MDCCFQIGGYSEIIFQHYGLEQVMASHVSDYRWQHWRLEKIECRRSTSDYNSAPIC